MMNKISFLKIPEREYVPELVITGMWLPSRTNGYTRIFVIVSPYFRHFSVTIFPVMPEKSGRIAKNASHLATLAGVCVGVAAFTMSDALIEEASNSFVGAITPESVGTMRAARRKRKTAQAICPIRTYFRLATHHPNAATIPGITTRAASANSAYVAFGSPKFEAKGREYEAFAPARMAARMAAYRKRTVRIVASEGRLRRNSTNWNMGWNGYKTKTLLPLAEKFIFQNHLTRKGFEK
jgi:hypothetical protein